MNLYRLISFLSSPKIFLVTLFWLMILVILGTLDQANIGLYQSQQKYFSSWVTWFGFLPVPGGRITLVVMFINLFSFILKPSFWSFKKIGIIIIHLGILLLLFGAGLTAWFSSEGMMAIREGTSSNFIFNSFKKELIIKDTSNSNYNMIISISDMLLKKKNIINNDKIPFTINVIDYFTNCDIKPRGLDFNSKELNYKGLAKNNILVKIENAKDYELNRTGITFEISNGDSANGIYSLILDQPINQKININGKELILELRRERTYLPFNIELIDFKKELHPGTNIAKSFSSRVNLNENEIKRSALIEMNFPLRYKNYTFYQSSFIENFNSDTTILSVVKNYGRLFPYISSIIMSIGLLSHIILKIPSLFQRKKRDSK